MLKTLVPLLACPTCADEGALMAHSFRCAFRRPYSRWGNCLRMLQNVVLDRRGSAGACSEVACSARRSGVVLSSLEVKD